MRPGKPATVFQIATLVGAGALGTNVTAKLTPLWPGETKNLKGNDFCMGSYDACGDVRPS